MSYHICRSYRIENLAKQLHYKVVNAYVYANRNVIKASLPLFIAYKFPELCYYNGITVSDQICVISTKRVVSLISL